MILPVHERLRERLLATLLDIGQVRLDLLTTEIVHWDVGSSSDPSELLFNTGDPAVACQ